MNKRLRLYACHGVDGKITKMVKDRLGIRFDANDSVEHLDMTLDEFATKWKDKFIVWPNPDDNETIIWITQHSNFGQRG